MLEGCYMSAICVTYLLSQVSSIYASSSATKALTL